MPFKSIQHKSLQLKTLMISFLLLSVLTFGSYAADLRVNIDRVNSDNGLIMAQLFAGKDNFNKGQAAQNLTKAANQGPAQLVFSDLSAGEYVVRMFHDENNNQSMDTNAFGMPTEGYAFSNEAVGNMGPPKYKDMIVIITEDEAESDAVVETNAKMTYL